LIKETRERTRSAAQRRAREGRPPAQQTRVQVRTLEPVNFGIPVAVRYATGQVVTTTEDNARQLIATRQAVALDDLPAVDRGPRRGRPMNIKTRSLLGQLQLRAEKWAGVADDPSTALAAGACAVVSLARTVPPGMDAGYTTRAVRRRVRPMVRKLARDGRRLQRDLALVAAALVYRAEGPRAGETPAAAWVRIKDTVRNELQRLLEDQRAIASPAAPHEPWAIRSAATVTAIKSAPPALG
jgi:hypothetical protein